MQANLQTTTLWQLIDTLARAMPLSKAAFEQATGATLQLKKQDAHASHWAAAEPRPLADGVRVLASHLLLGPQGEFDKTSAASLELDGTCLRIEDSRKHFTDLAITQAPRGRSPEETTVYESRQPWGTVSFAVKQAKSDCIVRVSLRP